MRKYTEYIKQKYLKYTLNILQERGKSFIFFSLIFCPYSLIVARARTCGGGSHSSPTRSSPCRCPVKGKHQFSSTSLIVKCVGCLVLNHLQVF